MGSDSDWNMMSHAVDVLKSFGIGSEAHIVSAHRTPERAIELASKASSKGFKVIIAGAGAAAHLAGMIAAHTLLPVIGVPLNATALGGLDALLATVQMPGGIPVATMAIGKPGAKNAGLMAVGILAVSRPALAAKLGEYRRAMAGKVHEKDRRLVKNI
ncbi:MAG: 5-(carboxyamino)imidazole ribonucleotide mutase [Deltaproteobacteria bacterium]|nr:5-(carboxyamino)imidazole ribonucleotide mutase [Deltaproteobacteria bacterium]